MTDVGLCERCAHCRVVETARSRFYLCRRSATDPSYRKYPRLPVIACRGFEAAHPDDSNAAGEPQ